jgi:hypothetical protein
MKIFGIALIVLGLVVSIDGDGTVALTMMISGAVLLGAAFVRKLVLDAVREGRQ